mmetsp:Transcript_792/g.1355  ORF Transcript_792/g.1355 Transcript_792/m.1355 type:complete len:209 (-) Transcript_792:96-722(-)
MQKIDTTNTRPARCAARSSDFMISLSPILSRRKASSPPPRNKCISNPATCTREKTEKSKEVRFNLVVCIKNFKTSLCDLQSSWYSREDLHSFEKKIVDDARILRRLLKKKNKRPLNLQEALTLDATPIRGIEQYLSSRIVLEARSRQQHGVILGVLAEQQRQRHLKVALAADLALVSVTHSFVARARGVELGMSDASEAKATHSSHST